MPKYLGVMLFGLCLCSASHAATVLTDGTGTKAEKIFNLDIDGTFYNIVFDYLSAIPGPIGCDFMNAPDVPCDPFAGDEPGALLAGNAIAQFFNTYNSLNPVDIVTVGDSNGTDLQALVPYKFGQGCNQFCAERVRYNVSIWFVEDAPDLGLDSVSVYARFTPGTPVPVPPAIYMFLSGIAVLGWFRRRKPV